MPNQRVLTAPISILMASNNLRVQLRSHPEGCYIATTIISPMFCDYHLVYLNTGRLTTCPNLLHAVKDSMSIRPACPNKIEKQLTVKTTTKW